MTKEEILELAEKYRLERPHQNCDPMTIDDVIVKDTLEESAWETYISCYHRKSFSGIGDWIRKGGTLD